MRQRVDRALQFRTQFLCCRVILIIRCDLIERDDTCFEDGGRVIGTRLARCTSALGRAIFYGDVTERGGHLGGVEVFQLVS